MCLYLIDAGGPWWVQPDIDVFRDGSWEVNCYELSFEKSNGQIIMHDIYFLFFAAIFKGGDEEVIPLIKEGSN